MRPWPFLTISPADTKWKQTTPNELSPPTLGIRRLDADRFPPTLILVLDVDPHSGAYLDMHWNEDTPLSWMSGHISSGYGGMWASGYFSHLQRVWKNKYGRIISLRTVKKQIAEFLEREKENAQ